MQSHSQMERAQSLLRILKLLTHKHGSENAAAGFMDAKLGKAWRTEVAKALPKQRLPEAASVDDKAEQFYKRVKHLMEELGFSGASVTGPIPGEKKDGSC